MSAQPSDVIKLAALVGTAVVAAGGLAIVAVVRRAFRKCLGGWR